MNLKTAAHWEKVGMHPHQGIVIPLFALHREGRSERGKFLDLIPMIEWCSEVGIDTLQLLPIYDTGGDPSPYNPISSCALDPIYLSLEAPSSNHLQSLREVYDPPPITPEFLSFVDHHLWVRPYALFKALSVAYGTSAWTNWKDDAQGPKEESYERHKKEIDFYAYLQFLCFEQMGKVKAFAKKKNVKLKGDLPILFSLQSVDVWCYRDLFDLHLVAGAPPDIYNELGQKWGFPIFRWEKDHTLWWKQRLSVISELFDIYRIDHVLGFFRIWAIELEKNAADGVFVPKDPSIWIDCGRRHLEMMINLTTALPIAEDLGVVTPGVRPLLRELGICSTKVVRWQQEQNSCIPYDQYEQFSMTTLSTHDMAPLPLWWKQCPEEAKAFASFYGQSYSPTLSHDLHFRLVKDSMHTSSLFHINPLQEFLLLFPELSLSDLEKVRINLPGTLSPLNWAYQFLPTVEKLTQHKELKQTMRQILQK